MKFFTFFKRKAVYIPLSGIILVVGYFIIYSATHKPVYKTAIAERKEFLDEISVTGKVVAANDVELAFESGGRVTSVSAAVGTKVSRGTVLARVNSADLYASLLSQQARLASAKIALAEAERGTRPTEIENLERDVEQAESDLENAVRDSFADADSSLRADIDILFTNPTGAYPEIINFDNPSREKKLEERRVEAGRMMSAWKKSILSLESGSYSDSYRIEADANLRVMRSFLDELAAASSYFEDSSYMTDAERATYIAGITSGRASINASISSLSAAHQSYVRAEDALELSKEGSTPEEIQRAQADVRSAEANVLQAQASLARTFISAPFDGVVTKTDIRVGEQVSSGAPVISMISNANFEIESYIPEADIAEVEIGDTGTTTLDAYGDDVEFAVIVTAIDLSETEVDGVSTYKTTLQFSAVDERIRSGMTANIDLVSEVRQNVLSIPQSAVVNKDGDRTVLVMDGDGKTEIRNVQTGSLDNDANIEIRSGLEKGETVVTNPPKK